jgi:hypothetical protein
MVWGEQSEDRANMGLESQRWGKRIKLGFGRSKTGLEDQRELEAETRGLWSR